MEPFAGPNTFFRGRCKKDRRKSKHLQRLLYLRKSAEPDSAQRCGRCRTRIYWHADLSAHSRYRGKGLRHGWSAAIGGFHELDRSVAGGQRTSRSQTARKARAAILGEARGTCSGSEPARP